MTATQPDTPKTPRYLILCFDGTGNKFGQNSNVVRFFHALKKDKTDNQLVYYQPGIGTYNKRQFVTHTASTIAAALDQAIALHLNDHVKGGYQFIMRNYKKGDKICLFGFSRGAYTARVLAGMLYKIGILPADNDEQVDFAFSIYQIKGDEGVELGKEFKKTFSAGSVNVDFLGVWDTVSSVGIIPRAHPYTSVNYAVKTFRHALALDERRARFRPNVWTEPTLEREQDIDFEDPEVEFPPQDVKHRDEWEYTPPKRDFCDVEEVWFAGCHADIGGGSHDNKIQDSLSYIPLRWMIKECMRKTDILFDYKQIATYGFKKEDLLQAYDEGRRENVGLSKEELNKYGDYEDEDHDLALARNREDNQIDPTPSHSITSRLKEHRLRRDRKSLDVVAHIWDQLSLVIPWWMLEVIPMLTTYQDPHSIEGDWVRRRERNFGRGRFVPFYNYQVKVHNSVFERMEHTDYQPAAYNWKDLKPEMIVRVDETSEEKTAASATASPVN